MDQQLTFPDNTSDDVKLQVIKILTDKDKQLEDKEKEIKECYKTIVKLESDLHTYHGALNYSQSKELKVRTHLAEYQVVAIERELLKRHLRIVKVNPPDGVPGVRCGDDVIRPFDMKVEKITIWERFSKWVKSLIPFEIKRKDALPESKRIIEENQNLVKEIETLTTNQ